jgi:exopolysaccharide biosynthesis polyprenyl glycosylphosphotransferase
MYNILRRHALLFNMTQRALDIAILLAITWLFANRYGSPELMRVLAIYTSLFLVAIFSLFNIYKSWRSTFISDQIKMLVIAWSSVLIVFNIIILLLSNKEQLAVLWPYGLFQSPEFLYWSLFVFLGLAAFRVAVKTVLVFIRERGYNQRSAVIVGAGRTGTRVAKYLGESRWMGINIIGFFDDESDEGNVVTASPQAFGSVLGPVDRCPEFSLTKGIDMVFIALPMRAEEKINRLIWDLGTKGVDVFMVPDLFTFGIQKSRVHHLGELHFLDLNLFPEWKRAFDIFFSLMVILLTLPFWLIIVALIKWEDGGPIFYKHTRIMESGKKFGCFKFRTMHANADQRLKELLYKDPALREEWECTYKIKNDPRVTKVGKFLRKTSLDELPQFLNVVAGQMSVVGARPIVPEELEKYYKETALTYCATKPGITGAWQCGKRSDTEDYAERVAIDNQYVLNCSLWLDIRIIFKTVWSMLSGKGAY